MKAIIYSRVSSTNDRQNTERQISVLKEYAKNNNIEIVKEYSEKISGATDNNNRNVLNDAIEFAKNNNIDLILFSELSRLGRNVLNIIEMVKYLSDNGINAYFHKENLTLLDNNGKVQPTTTILISCLGMVAEIERENIMYRLNTGREIAKSKNVKMGRKVGFRYTAENYQKKYGGAISLIRKGYKLCEVQSICRDKGLNVGLSTLSTLKKMFK